MWKSITLVGTTSDKIVPGDYAAAVVTHPGEPCPRIRFCHTEDFRPLYESGYIDPQLDVVPVGRSEEGVTFKVRSITGTWYKIVVHGPIEVPPQLGLFD